MMAGIEFRDFSYAYKGGAKVLNKISLVIPSGSFTVLTGPTGAGKTTLCLAIAGLVPQYFGGSLAGEVLLDGDGLMGAALADTARRVGIVLEDYESQLLTMTVAEEVAFSLENQGLARPEIERRSQEALAAVDLLGREASHVAALSGGQKQRLAIASVLAAAPEVLVLDEPASALDPAGAAELYQLLGRLNRTRQLTIVVVEHDLSRVLTAADKLVLLADGRVAAAGTIAEVMRLMAHDEAFCGSVPALWQLRLLLEEDGEQLGTEWQSAADAVASLKSYLKRGAKTCWN